MSTNTDCKINYDEMEAHQKSLIAVVELSRTVVQFC
jgi:hypothetical protein